MYTTAFLTLHLHCDSSFRGLCRYTTQNWTTFQFEVQNLKKYCQRTVNTVCAHLNAEGLLFREWWVDVLKLWECCPSHTVQTQYPKCATMYCKVYCIVRCACKHVLSSVCWQAPPKQIFIWFSKQITYAAPAPDFSSTRLEVDQDSIDSQESNGCESIGCDGQKCNVLRQCTMPGCDSLWSS